MKVLTVSQNKGGTGKTALSLMVAEGMARRGQRVLGIDLDSQANFSRRLISMENSGVGWTPTVHPAWPDKDDPDWDGYSSIANIFYGEMVVQYPTAIPNLDVLPAHGPNLLRVEMVNAEAVTEKVHNRLRDFLRDPDVMASYDLVVVDTSPSKNPLTVCAIRAATHVLIPTVMEPECIDGLPSMFGLWMHENRLRDPDDAINMLGILPNMYRPHTALHSSMYESIRNDELLGANLIPHSIGHRIGIAELAHEQMRGNSIFTMRESEPARMEAEAVVNYIGNKMGML